MIASARTSRTFCNTPLVVAVLAIERFCRFSDRRGRGNYAIIANCELVTVVVVTATVLGEKLTLTRVLGGGLTLAGILLHSWVHKPTRDRLPKSPGSPLLNNLPPARHTGDATRSVS
jgi:hypothetical protein